MCRAGTSFFARKNGICAKVAKRIEDGIEKKCGFRCDVICRTTAEMKKVVAKNPFAKRRDIHPGKLLVTFLSDDPGEEARASIRALKIEPEELWMRGVNASSIFLTGWAARNSIGPRSERCSRCQEPAATGTASRKCWTWLRRWKPSRDRIKAGSNADTRVTPWNACPVPPCWSKICPSPLLLRKRNRRSDSKRASDQAPQEVPLVFPLWDE